MPLVRASLFDQTHKLFVPGREFDASDLVFDVLGYGVGIVLMFGVVESFVAI
ncbi:MAG: VanZ family protein [Collinsella aerofaciens]